MAEPGPGPRVLLPPVPCRLSAFAHSIPEGCCSHPSIQETRALRSQECQGNGDAEKETISDEEEMSKETVGAGLGESEVRVAS